MSANLSQVRDILCQVHQTLPLGNLRDNYAKLIQEITYKLRNLELNELRVVLVAPSKAGKSTLINTIIGAELIPSGIRGITTLPIEIRFNPELKAPKLNIKPEITLLCQKVQGKIYRQIQRTDKQSILDKIADYPQLRPLVAKIEQSIYLVIPEQASGFKAINYYLTALNDLMLLSSLINSSQKLLNQLETLPRLETPLFNPQIKLAPLQLTKLVIVDTPGLDTQEHNWFLKQLLERELEKSSILWLMLDFTRIKSQIEPKINQTMLEIMDKYSPIAVLVNKIDQRQVDDLMTTEAVLRWIVAELGLNENRQDLGKGNESDGVWEISARQAWSVVQFWTEVAHSNDQNQDITGSFPAARSLAEIIFGLDWESKLEQANQQELEEKALKVWHKSGFDLFLSKVVNPLLAEIDQEAARSHDNFGQYCLLKVQKDLTIFSQSLEDDYQQLQQQILILKQEQDLAINYSNFWSNQMQDFLTKLDIDLQQILVELIDLESSPQLFLDDLVAYLTNNQIKTKVIKFKNQSQAQKVTKKVINLINQYLESWLEQKILNIEYNLEAQQQQLSLIISQYLLLIINNAQNRFPKITSINSHWQIPSFAGIVTTKNQQLNQINLRSSMSIWGQMHNSIIIPLNQLKFNLPVVDNGYLLDIPLYLDQVVLLMVQEINYLRITFEEYLKQNILQQSSYYLQDINNFLSTYQQLLSQSLEQQQLSALKCQELSQKIKAIIRAC